MKDLILLPVVLELFDGAANTNAVSYTHLRAHET